MASAPFPRFPAPALLLCLSLALMALGACTASHLGPPRVAPVQRLGLAQDSLPLPGGGRLEVVRGGEGPAELLVIGASWWLPDALDAFGEHTFAAVDLRVRSGASAASSAGGSGGFERDAEDLARFLARERRAGGAAPVVLAAGYHALVLLAALELEPDAARALVLVAPMPLVRDPHLAAFAREIERRSDGDEVRRFERLLAAGRPSPELVAVRRRVLLGPRFADPARVEQMRADPYAVPGIDPEALGRHLQETLAGMGAWDFGPRAAKLHLEAWIVHGVADALPSDVARQWAQSLPRARLTLMETSGAFPWIEAPAAFAEVLAEALASP